MEETILHSLDKDTIINYLVYDYKHSQLVFDHIVEHCAKKPTRNDKIKCLNGYINLLEHYHKKLNK